jgi:hypothetical protein
MTDDWQVSTQFPLGETLNFFITVQSSGSFAVPYDHPIMLPIYRLAGFSKKRDSQLTRAFEDLVRPLFPQKISTISECWHNTKKQITAH